jgi:hypothetical protein
MLSCILFHGAFAFDIASFFHCVVHLELSCCTIIASMTWNLVIGILLVHGLTSHMLGGSQL